MTTKQVLLEVAGEALEARFMGRRYLSTSSTFTVSSW
jgi:hypothetical protein